MAWTERQVAMLAEMGLQVPVQARTAPAVAGRATASAVVEPQPSARTPAPAVTTPAIAERIDSTRPPRGQFADAGWPELRESAAGCTACGLSAGRTRSVFGVGSLQAHWMVIGEAPNDQDDAAGEPFVGKPGQLLDNMLAAIGLRRAENDDGEDGRGAETPLPATRVYIANAVKCRPPGNRNPAPDELATCDPYLVRQVELLGPKIILAMGPLAVQHLLQTDEPIGRLRGRVHRWQGVPLIVTYHPAYLARNPVDKARAWDDLCLARETYAALPA